jgi:glycosyltransferase involved in cell wall biosynthesis
MFERKKVLLAHPYITPPGGGEGLAAYVLQALQGEYDVSIACYQPPAYETLNRYFGTDLQAENFTLYQVPKWLTWVLEHQPTPQALLRSCVLEAFIKRLAKRHHFDIYFSAINELSFPKRGIQYIHFPRTYPVRPSVDYRWFHWLPGLLQLYRRCCYWIGGMTWADLRHNLTLANSDYIASVFEGYHHVKPRIVFPPAPGHFTVQPWAEKKAQIVYLGRMAPEKDLPKVIEIIRQLRALGHDLSLIVIGTWDCSEAYRRNLRRLLTQHRDWVRCEQGITRQEVIRLLEESRYGIHGMVGEHFGMAVAEMQQAGCIVFVPHIGGPVEIVGHEPRLIYASVEEAVTKIDAVLRDPILQTELYQHSLRQRVLFTTERFVCEIQEIVRQFVRASSTTSEVSSPLL